MDKVKGYQASSFRCRRRRCHRPWSLWVARCCHTWRQKMTQQDSEEVIQARRCAQESSNCVFTLHVLRMLMSVQPWLNHDLYKVVQTPSSAKFPGRFLEIQNFACCKAKDGSLLPRDVLACLTAFGAARRKAKGGKHLWFSDKIRFPNSQVVHVVST